MSFSTRSSHVRVFETCARKWLLNEVDDSANGRPAKPDPDTVAKTFGTTMHLILEHWLRDAKTPGFSKEASAAKRSIPHLPVPGAGLIIERKFERVLEDGTVYYSTADVIDARPQAQLVRSKNGQGVRLLDHKSTANLKYAKTPDELGRDVSAVAYAIETRRVLEEMGIDEKEIHCRWNYVPRLSNDPCVPVEFTVTRAAQRERWSQTLDSVGKMRRISDATAAGGVRWQDVTPNYGACDNFGGCQFRAQCAMAKATGKSVGAALAEAVNKTPPGLKENEMGLLDDLRNKLPVGQGVSAPATATAATVTATATATALAVVEAPTPVLTIAQPPSQGTLPPQAPPPASKPTGLAALLSRKKAPTVAQIVASSTGETVTTPLTIASSLEAGEDIEDGEPTEAELVGEADLVADAAADEPDGMSYGINPIEAPPPDLQKDTVEKKKRTKRTKTVDPETQAIAEAMAQAAVAEAAASESTKQVTTAVVETQGVILPVAGPGYEVIVSPVTREEAAELTKSLKAALEPVVEDTPDLPAQQISVTYGGPSAEAAMLAKLRKYAEVSDLRDNEKLTLFIAANKLERGEL